MKLDLQSMSLAELQDLQASVEKAIASKEQQAEIIARIKALAVENGLSLDAVASELQGTGRSKGSSIKAKSAPQYYNPAAPEQTWTGKGRKPKWIEEALAAGRDLEEFRIKS
ncbi:H-NS histone family protein [Balneatrix alpica]|uniref:H-NS family nucleoid-associated regulatory protein n=1 Tax=Balneatrix alpica TaxID=75684 RepID=A0ABV5ZAA7_9GAMM|nr:H-NS histone family protein [Balneatrix alpica]